MPDIKNSKAVVPILHVLIEQKPRGAERQCGLGDLVEGFLLQPVRTYWRFPSAALLQAPLTARGTEGGSHEYEPSQKTPAPGYSGR